MNTRHPSSESTDRDGALLQYIDSIHGNPDGAAGDTYSLHNLCIRLAQTKPQADDAFRQTLEARVVAAATRRTVMPHPSAKTRQARREIRARSARAAAVALVILGLGVGLWAASPARARLQRVACYVPGLGIRSCNEPGLIAPQPVSISRDGITLAVTHVISSSAPSCLE